MSVASLACVVCCPAVQLQSVTEASLAIHLIKFFLEFFQVYKRQKWEQVCDNLTCLVCLLPWRSTAKRDTGFKLNPIGTQSAALCGNNWSLEWERTSWNRINPKMWVTSISRGLLWQNEINLLREKTCSSASWCELSVFFLIQIGYITFSNGIRFLWFSL